MDIPSQQHDQAIPHQQKAASSLASVPIADASIVPCLSTHRATSAMAGPTLQDSPTMYGKNSSNAPSLVNPCVGGVAMPLLAPLDQACSHHIQDSMDPLLLLTSFSNLPRNVTNSPFPRHEADSDCLLPSKIQSPIGDMTVDPTATVDLPCHLNTKSGQDASDDSLQREMPSFPSSANGVSDVGMSPASTFPRLLSAPQSEDGSTAPSTSRLHRICALFSHKPNVIAGAVQADPESVRSRLPRKRSSFLRKRRKGECDYPINIALQHNAPFSVLKLLANAGPKVLVDGDAPEWGSALSFALYKRQGIDVIAMLLKANRSQVRVRDRHLNYPLHVACISASSFPVIQLLASRCRRVLHKRNFHGQTPLDIARRNPRCSDQVVDYLEQVMFPSAGENAIHIAAMSHREEAIGGEESKVEDVVEESAPVVENDM